MKEGTRRGDEEIEDIAIHFSVTEEVLRELEIVFFGLASRSTNPKVQYWLRALNDDATLLSRERQSVRLRGSERLQLLLEVFLKARETASPGGKLPTIIEIRPLIRKAASQDYEMFEGKLT